MYYNSKTKDQIHIDIIVRPIIEIYCMIIMLLGNVYIRNYPLSAFYRKYSVRNCLHRYHFDVHLDTLIAVSSQMYQINKLFLLPLNA